MPDDFDAPALLAALDATEAAGVPVDLVERLRWLVEKEVATRPRGWFAELGDSGAPLQFCLPVGGASGDHGWPPEIVERLTRRGSPGHFVYSMAPLRDANAWLDDLGMLRPIASLPPGLVRPRLLKVEPLPGGPPDAR